MAKSPVRLFLCACLAAPALALPSGLLAQEPLVTDRPDFTESASSVQRGRVQIEAGATRDEADPGHVTTIGEILARIGIVPGIELRLGVPSAIDSGVGSGLGNAFLGGKAEIPAGERWEVAVLAGTTVPVGDDDVSPDAWEPEVVVAFGRDLRGADLGINVGWGRPVEGEDEDRVDEFVASGAAGFDLGGGWGAFAEAFGFATTDDAGPAFLSTGLTRLLGPDLQLDGRVGAGLFQASGDWFVGIGFSRRW